MAVEDRLSRFVEEALLRGVSREQIEPALHSAGWRRDARSRHATRASHSA